MLIFIVIVRVKLYFASSSLNGGITVTRKARKPESLILFHFLKIGIFKIWARS